jgi:hypothetical protein
MNEEASLKNLMREAEHYRKAKNVRSLHDVADVLQEKSFYPEACRVRKWARDILKKLSEVEA